MTEFEGFQEGICEEISDLIIDHADRITQEMGDWLMTMFRAIDETESFHAAHIRDTLRDNTEWRAN